MGLKQRMDRLARELDPNPEDMLTVILDLRGLADRGAQGGQPATPPPLKGNDVAPFVSVVFLGGNEAQQRAALKRLRRRYRENPP